MKSDTFLNTLKEQLTKMRGYTDWQIRETTDPYQRGYYAGQKHLVLKLLEKIKDGGL